MVLESLDGSPWGRASEAPGKQVRTVRSVGNREVVELLEPGEFASGNLTFPVNSPLGQRLQLAEQRPNSRVGGFGDHPAGEFFTSDPRTQPERNRGLEKPVPDPEPVTFPPISSRRDDGY